MRNSNVTRGPLLSSMFLRRKQKHPLQMNAELATSDMLRNVG